jgi:hydroxymethylglutaryl-CoA synthase
MSDPHVAGIGAYAPRLRIAAEAFEEGLGRFDAAGIDRKAVPEADEDALTMAVAAARRALDAAGRDGADVAYLAFATTTPPMDEEDVTARLVSAVGAPQTVATRTLTGSTRAGGQALDAAVDAGPWEDTVGLVVASDCPRAAPDDAVEHAAGAGAAAVVLDREGPGTVADRAGFVEPYPGTRFREGGTGETTGLGITGYDRESFTRVLGGAAEALADAPVDAAAVQSPDGKLPYRAAGPLGVDAETIAAGATVEDLGDTGAASPLLGLATAVNEGHDRVLLAAYGSGAGATVLRLTGLDAVPASVALDGDAELDYAAYLRRRGELTSGEPDGGGAYVSVPSWQRTIPQRHRLVAGRCEACDALNFPPSGACRECNERSDFAHVALPGTGTVEAVTTIAQGGAPPEFVEQQARSGAYGSAVVALDGPAEESAVSVPTQVVGAPDAVEIGSRVAMTLRRIYEQEGVVRYGFKAQPVETRR